MIGKFNEVEDFDRRIVLLSQNDSRLFCGPVCKLFTDSWVSRSKNGTITILVLGLNKVKRHMELSTLWYVLCRLKFEFCRMSLMFFQEGQNKVIEH